jgi:RHS repeat-associated protein
MKNKIPRGCFRSKNAIVRILIARAKIISSKVITVSVIFSLIFSSFMPLWGINSIPIMQAAEIGYAAQQSTASMVVDGIGTAKGLSITSASSTSMTTTNNNILPSQSHVDESSGAFLWSLPITLPAGRANHTPSLTLSYDSRRNNPTGYIAKGWELDIPYIQRINKVGVDLMYDRPDFASSTQGELTKLVPINPGSLNQSGFYGAKVGYGRYELRNDNSWSMTDLDGNVYIYGSTVQHREQGSNTNISSWYLSKITDPSGNKIEYVYTKDTYGRIYPSAIIYGDGMYKVNFEWTMGSIPQSAYLLGTAVDYAAGVRSKADRILEAISVLANSEARLRYSLVNSQVTTYTNATGYMGTSATSPTKKNITQIKICGTNTGISIGQNYTGEVDSCSLNETYTFSYSPPPVTSNSTGSTGYGGAGFTILTAAPGLPASMYGTTSSPYNIQNTITPNWLQNATNSNNPIRYTYIDLDGDGWKENVSFTYTYNNSTQQTTYIMSVFGINAAKTGYEIKPSYTFSIVNQSNISNFDPIKTQLADIDGDGDVDMIVHKSIYTNGNYVPTNTFYRNTGNIFVGDATAVLPNTPTDVQNTILKDINGDLKADLIFLRSNPSRMTVYVSTGDNFVLNSGYTVIGGQWNTSYYNNPDIINFIDINGDNFDDLVRNNEVFLNRRTHFEFSESYSISGTIFGQNSMYDINGDTLPDVPSITGFGTTSTTSVGALINTGLGWKYIPNAALSDVYNYSNQYGEVSGPQIAIDTSNLYTTNSPVDLNSDGILDIVKTGSTVVDNIRIHPGTRENIMMSIYSPTGNTTTITYDHEVLKNTNTAGKPTSQYVVKSVSESTAPVNTTTYTYENGLQYYNNEDMSKKFAGFEKVTTVNTEGIKEISYYHQGNTSNTTLGEYDDNQYKIGREYRTEIYTPNVGTTPGTLAKTIINKWASGDLGSGRSLVFKEWTLTRNSLGGAYDTAIGYTYDTAYGQLVRVNDMGLVTGTNNGTFSDVGNDMQKTDYKYITDGSIVRQSVSTLRDQNNKVLKQTATIYDNGILSRGLPTEIHTWVDANTVAKTKYIYNNFGLQISTTDSLGHITATEYDTYNLYPSKVINAKGQFIKFENYDYMAGKPTKVTEASGIVMNYKYDIYGRETEAKKNGVQIRSRTYNPTQHQINYSNNSNMSTGFNETIGFDGLGRVSTIQNVKKGYSYFTYNSSGRRITENVPNTMYGSASGLITTYAYDTLGRVVSATNSLGTTTTLYNGLETSITNPKNITTKYIYDIRGNLLSVVENFTSANPYTTSYTYDGNRNLIELTDAENNKRNFVTNMRGDVLSATDLHTTTDTSYGLVKKNYDQLGRIVKITLQDNKTISYVYDSLGRVISSVSGTSTTPEETITYIYDTCGQTFLCSESSSLGVTTGYTYNSEGFVASKTQTIDGTSLTKSYTYDTQDQLLTITQPDGTTIAYDRTMSGANIQKINIDGVDLISNIYYDTESRISSVKYPTVNPVSEINVQYTYDQTKMLQLTNQKTTIYPNIDLINTTYTYDANGNITGATETGYTPLTSTKSFNYDDYDRLISYTTIPTGGSTSPSDTNSYMYSSTGNMTASGADVHSFGQPTPPPIPPANGSSQNNQNNNPGSNNNGGLSIQIKNDDLSSKFANLINSLKHKLNKIARFNPFNINKAYASPSCTPPQIFIQATNSCGLLTQCISPQILNTSTNSCITPITMNELQKFFKSRGFENQQSGRAIIKAGHTKVTITLKDGITAIPVISATPTSKTDAKYYISNIFAGSFRINLFEPNTEPINFNWTAIQQPDDNNSIIESQDDIYGIDEADLTINVANNNNLINTANTLYTEQNTNTGPTSAFTSPQAVTKITKPIGDIVYTYDPRGNLASELVPTLISQNGIPVTVNLVTTHEWNTKNKITKTTLPNGDTIMYKYAPSGDRVMKTFVPFNVTTTNPIKITTYMDDEYEIDQSVASVGGTVITDKTRSRIMLGSVHVATIEKTAGTTPTVSKYYQFTNPVGSSTITTDTTGTVIQTQDTKPYGGYRVNIDTQYTAPTPATSTTGIIAGTTGVKDYYALHERDIETNLTYMNARMYDETMPTFLSLDPTSQYNPQSILKDPQQLNLYSYARNNPVRYNDPSGEFIMKTGKIEKGDTLGGITNQINKKYGTKYTVNQIASANGIKNANLIHAGNSIKLPKSSMQLTYNGKTLQAIDKTYGNSFGSWSGGSGSIKRNFAPIAEGNWQTVDPSQIQYWDDLSFANKVGSTISKGIEWAKDGRKTGGFPGGTYAWGTQRTELHSLDGGPQAGFYIHGGRSMGSAGCIDLTDQNDSFHDFFRDYGKPLDLIVSY